MSTQVLGLTPRRLLCAAMLTAAACGDSSTDPTVPYVYTPPPETGDGWVTASLEDTGADVSLLEALAGELDERDLVNLHIDLRQMGVGGINSWGPTAMPKYQLPYGEYRLRFRLRGFDAADGTPDAVSKTIFTWNEP